ncbi:MAG: hypothetical protein ACTSQZ_05205, partial [Candidatus Thorarchaeota archaeon]
KKASLPVLIEDLKISFKFAGKNVISFILGMIGVAIVSLLLLAAIAAVVIPIIFLYIGLDGIIQIGLDLATTFNALTGATLFLIILLIATPIIAPLTVALGALFGMAREIVESDGTTAEGVFTWYKSKFFSLAGGGLTIFLIAIAPMAIIMGLIGPINLISYDPVIVSVGLALIVIFYSFTTGFISLVFPAIIDGNSVIESVKISVRLAWKHFDRVFSVWLSYIGMLFLAMAPMMAMAFLGISDPFGPALGSLAIYGLGAAIFVVLLLFPATVIGMTRIYMILTGDEISTSQDALDESTPDFSLVGGV